MHKLILLLVGVWLCAGWASAQRTVVQVEGERSTVSPSGKSLKRKVAIARFSNETQYAKGLFYDKENDPMGKQASDILATRLAASEKFLLLERSDLDKLQSENELNKTQLQQIAADYLILGSITQFGRKNVGDQRVFSSTKTQIVEAAVSIRLVDVKSGLIIYSDEAKGDAELKSKETLGVGGKADYDATLSDKAISAAISKLVENIINKCTDKPWRGYFMMADADATIISGGASQGIAVGDCFLVKKRGKQVTNPQTGVQFELPGKQVGKVRVEDVQGDTPETEYSLVSFVEGAIDTEKLDEYYIEECKP
ncbi:MAG: CsgG/HfaB family protein [Parabacteroides sp.]